VLKRPGAKERAVLDEAIENAADAVELIVVDGVETAMNRVNTAT
jgi:peptidyl-tRNA hydrolase